MLHPSQFFRALPHAHNANIHYGLKLSLKQYSIMNTVLEIQYLISYTVI